MSVFYAPGTPDEAFAGEMTIILNPIQYDPRYQPGFNGLVVSLIRLGCVAFGTDLEEISSVLGDMAHCMGIDCLDLPKKGSHVNFGKLQLLYYEFEKAVDANDEVAAVRGLRKMLRAAGLIDRKARPKRSA